MKLKIVVAASERELTRAGRLVDGIFPFNPMIMIPELHDHIQPLLVARAVGQAVLSLRSLGVADYEVIIASQLEQFALDLYQRALEISGIPASTLRLPAQFPWPLIPYSEFERVGGHMFAAAVMRVEFQQINQDWWPFPGDPV